MPYTRRQPWRLSERLYSAVSLRNFSSCIRWHLGSCTFSRCPSALPTWQTSSNWCHFATHLALSLQSVKDHLFLGLTWCLPGCMVKPMHNSWSLEATLSMHSWMSFCHWLRSRQWSNRRHCKQWDGFVQDHHGQPYQILSTKLLCLCTALCLTMSQEQLARGGQETFLVSTWLLCWTCPQRCPQRRPASSRTTLIILPSVRFSTDSMYLLPYYINSRWRLTNYL